MQRFTIGDLLRVAQDVDIDTEVFVDVRNGLSIRPVRSALLSLGEREALVLSTLDVDSEVAPKTAKGGE